MFCIKCGQQLPDNALYCSLCGYNFNETKQSNTSSSEIHIRETIAIKAKRIPTALIVIAILSLIVGIFLLLYVLTDDLAQSTRKVANIQKQLGQFTEARETMLHYNIMTIISVICLIFGVITSSIAFLNTKKKK